MYLIRKRQLGDVVWIEPIIRKLSNKYKKVVVFTKYNEIFNHNIYDNVVFKSELSIFEKLLIQFDIFFHSSFFSINLDNSYEIDPKQHILHAYQKKAQLPIENVYPEIILSKVEKEKSFFKEKKYAIIHIESFSIKNYRNIHGITWPIIANFLKQSGYLVVQVGKNNQNIYDTVFIKTDIRDLMSIISNASLFIGIDSFPSHLAAIFKVPSLTFFGAINPNFRHFSDQFNGKFLQGFCEYAGCYHTSKNLKEISCSIVGDNGIPKCALYDTNKLIEDIKHLINKSNI